MSKWLSILAKVAPVVVGDLFPGVGGLAAIIAQAVGEAEQLRTRKAVAGPDKKTFAVDRVRELASAAYNDPDVAFNVPPARAAEMARDVIDDVVRETNRAVGQDVDEPAVPGAGALGHAIDPARDNRAAAEKPAAAATAGAGRKTAGKKR